MIEIAAYNANWPAMFEKEARRIKHELGANCMAVHHIGSTSVPGLCAKPKIDIIVVVKDETQVDLEELDYVCKGELNIPFRLFFSKRSEDIDVNMHLYEEGDAHIKLNIMFRNYLRDHSKVREKKYGALKKRLAVQEHASDKTSEFGLPQYTLEKNDFIGSVLQKVGFDELYIQFCMHDKEWEVFHRIRKALIFDRSNIEYDKKHESFSDPSYKHFVLYKGVDIIGEASIQKLDEARWALRSLSVDTSFQRHGCGSVLLGLVEKWIKRQKSSLIQLHAAPEAIAFYKSLGYKHMPFLHDVSINPSAQPMGKKLFM